MTEQEILNTKNTNNKNRRRNLDSGAFRPRVNSTPNETTSVQSFTASMLTFALVAPFVGYEALSTRIRIFLKTEFFFSGYSFCPHVNCVFGNRNRSSLKTVSRRYIFFNRIFLEPCEQRGKRRFSKTMTSNVVDRQLERFENSTCERGLFQKTSVFKNIRMRVDRQKRFENATCERGFFRKREKKTSVFKNLRIRVDGA